MFGYQPTVDSLELKKTKLLIMFLAKNEREYILPKLYTILLHSTKPSGYRIEIKFHEDTLAVEQNNYLIKIVNVYIVYD